MQCLSRARWRRASIGASLNPTGTSSSAALCRWAAAPLSDGPQQTHGRGEAHAVVPCQHHYKAEFASLQTGAVRSLVWQLRVEEMHLADAAVLSHAVRCCALQTFKQTENPAILYNGNNEYLHYEDTWYILGYKPDTYVVRRLPGTSAQPAC